MRSLCLHASFEHKKRSLKIAIFVVASIPHRYARCQEFGCLFYLSWIFPHSLKLPDVVDLLHLKELQIDVCYITNISEVKKDATENDSYSNCSDREFQAEVGHLTAKLLYGEAEMT